MLSDVTPLDVKQHRTIIVISEANRIRCLADRRSRFIFDSTSILIMTDPKAEVHIGSNTIQSLYRRGLLTENSILVQTPYDLYSYVPLSDISETILYQKYMYFSHICQLLGARKVAVTQLERTENQRTVRWNIKGGVLIYASTDIGFSRDIVERKLRELNLVIEFSGGETNTEAVEKFLASSGLDGDEQIVNLVRMCRGHSSKLKSYSISISTDNESRQTVKLFESLIFPIYLADIQAQIQKYTESYANYLSTTLVEFP